MRMRIQKAAIAIDHILYDIVLDMSTLAKTYN